MPSATPPRSSEELLAALDPDQREVAEHLTGPMCVLAGAGTGKTRAITYRIANGVAQGLYQPTQVLAVTFTARAAGEMRSRLADLGVHGVQARTFHAAAMRQLRYFWPSTIGGTMPEVAPHKAPLVSTALQRLGVASDKEVVRDVAAEIEWAKVTMTLPEDYPQIAQEAGRDVGCDLDFQTVAQAMTLYEDAKGERGVIDFEDVLLLMVGLLLEREQVAAQVRGQYKHFVVDEYQDVSPLQQRLLDLWLGPRRQLCVVGDVSQTIYSFTGASSRYLTSFEQRYEGARTVTLNRDYRSTPQVVSVANELLRGATRRGTMPAGAVTLVAQQPSGPAVSYMSCQDDVDEAASILARIRDLSSQGVAYKDMAILYRTNAQSQVFEQVLGEANVPYIVHGGERFFSRAEVKQAMLAMQAALRVPGDLSGDLGEDTRQLLGRLGWTQEAPAVRGARRERWDTLNALVSLADDLAATRQASMSEFITELRTRAEAQHAPTIDGVTLATMHATKGLEWEAVFLAGMSDGLMPLSMAQDAQAIEEERRLLYVGVTRARRYLTLSMAKARSEQARATRSPSRFLAQLWPMQEGMGHAAAGAGRSGGRHGTGAQRVTRGDSPRARSRAAAEEFEREADAPTRAIFEALRAWRAQTATEQSRPAYTIFADSVLRAIAQVKPTKTLALSAIRGVGGVKLKEYGPDVLRIVRQTLEETQDD